MSYFNEEEKNFNVKGNCYFCGCYNDNLRLYNDYYICKECYEKMTGKSDPNIPQKTVNKKQNIRFIKLNDRHENIFNINYIKNISKDNTCIHIDEFEFYYNNDTEAEKEYIRIWDILKDLTE